MDNIKQSSKNLYQKSTGFTESRLQYSLNEVSDGDIVLEIGVGWGELTKCIKTKKNIKLYAVDLAEKALENIKDYVEDSQLLDISSEKLKFEENKFDVVICLEVFEHLLNPYHAICEIQRVLKPGGVLVLSVPNYLGGHLMIYPGLITPKFFKTFLRQNYFKIKQYHVWGSLFNKGNIGRLVQSKTKSEWVAIIVLRLSQVFIRILQFLTRLFFIKWSRIYWCHIFVCQNKKDLMDKALWLKQLEQTSDLTEIRGWYDSYFHKKV